RPDLRRLQRREPAARVQNRHHRSRPELEAPSQEIEQELHGGRETEDRRRDRTGAEEIEGLLGSSGGDRLEAVRGQRLLGARPDVRLTVEDERERERHESLLGPRRSPRGGSIGDQRRRRVFKSATRSRTSRYVGSTARTWAYRSYAPWGSPLARRISARSYRSPDSGA